MTKFNSELYSEQFHNMAELSFEASDLQTKSLHFARAYLLAKAGVVDLTNKELLLLNHYVREAIRKRDEGVSSQVNPAEEAAEKWFLHITNYHITDFRGKFRRPSQEPGLLPKEAALIDELREKYNRDDD